MVLGEVDKPLGKGWAERAAGRAPACGKVKAEVLAVELGGWEGQPFGINNVLRERRQQRVFLKCET
jgi:hypothetical protein